MRWRRLAAGGAFWAGLFFAASLALSSGLQAQTGPGTQQERQPAINGTGLPIPRFVSLKASRANVRKGPSLDHAILWTFTRPGLPLEITAEFGNWRRVRDWEGDAGWMHHSLLEGRRTVMVTGARKGARKGAKKDEDLYALHQRPGSGSPVAAYAERGLVARLSSCTGAWCRVAAQGEEGWIERKNLWGLYPDEKIE